MTRAKETKPESAASPAGSHRGERGGSSTSGTAMYTVAAASAIKAHVNGAISLITSRTVSVGLPPVSQQQHTDAERQGSMQGQHVCVAGRVPVAVAAEP